MKKIYLFLLISIVFIVTVNAQTPLLKWAKTFNGKGASTDSTSVMKVYNLDKSIYIAGTSDAYGTANDIVLIKRDYATGDTLWTRRYNGPDNSDDQAVDMAINQTTGDVYITGKSLGAGTGYDIVTLKYSPSGVLGWVERWDNSTYHGDDIPKYIGIDNTGRIYVSAYTFDGNTGYPVYYDDLLVLVYNSLGSLTNSKKEDIGEGELNDDLVGGAIVNNNGDIFIGGESMYGTINNGYSEVFVCGLKSNLSSYYPSSWGNIISVKIRENWLWTPDDFNFYNAMSLDNTDNVYIASLMDTITHAGTYFKIVFTKINSTGNILWQKKIDGNENYKNLRVNSIKVDPGNLNVYAVGYEKNSSGNFDWFVIKYNSAGVFQWRVNRDGSGHGNDMAYDLAFDNLQNPIVTGFTKNSNGNDDITLVKYNKTNGSELYSVNYNSGNGDDKAYNIIVDANQNIIINGVENTSTQSQNMITLQYCNPAASAGVITGETTVCQGQDSVTYTVPEIDYATSYIWALPSGATGTSTTNSIAVNYGASAVSGNVTVHGHNDCTDGAISSLAITINPSSLPEVVTSNISSATFSTAKCGGVISYDGCPTLTAQGVCWSTIENPTISDSKTSDSLVSNEFTSNLTGLIPGMTYYIRAYATNIKGTAYGVQKSFTTKGSDEWNNVSDYDGNNYTTLTVGNQVWMGQNLKTTSYNDGTVIPQVTDNTAWVNNSSAAFCWYDNDVNNKDQYGALYNWYAVNTGILCPKGWHVPTYDDWKTLENYLINNGFNFDGTTSGNKISKALASTTGWAVSTNAGVPGNTDYTDKRNKSGFNAIPAGGRRGDNGKTDYMSKNAGWWSSTVKQDDPNYIWGFQIDNYSVDMTEGGYSRILGFSVRCVRDELVNSVPAKAGAISGNTNVCQATNNEIYTVPSIAAAASYIWTLPSGASGESSTNSISVNFNTAASGTISVKGHNDFGDGEIASISVIVNAPSKSPTVGTITQPTCSVATGSIELSGLPSGNWTINPGAITGSTTSKTISELATGTYNFTVTNASGCTSNASADVVINAQPTKPATPIISLLNDSTLHSDAPIGNQWYNQSGMINGARNQEFIVKEKGDYYAIVTINGCVSDTSNVITVVISGVTLYGNQKTIKIYPNPFTKELIIEIKGNTKNIDFDILNSLGQVVFKGKLLEKTIVPTSSFAPGIYLIRFERGNNLEFKKIIRK